MRSTVPTIVATLFINLCSIDVRPSELFLELYKSLRHVNMTLALPIQTNLTYNYVI